jgi:hypothetical protein
LFKTQKYFLEEHYMFLKMAVSYLANVTITGMEAREEGGREVAR